MRHIAKIELKPLTNSQFLKEMKSFTSKILHCGLSPDILKEEFDILAIVIIYLNIDIKTG